MRPLYVSKKSVVVYKLLPQEPNIVIIWNATSVDNPGFVLCHPVTSQHICFTPLNVPPVHICPLAMKSEQLDAHWSNVLAL